MGTRVLGRFGQEGSPDRKSSAGAYELMTGAMYQADKAQNRMLSPVNKWHFAPFSDLRSSSPEVEK